MFSNYVKVILRSIYKARYFAAFNVAGLAIGYASFLLVMIFVQYETSFDEFHSKSSKIFRLAYSYNSGNEYAVKWARVPVDYINELPKEFPEVKQLIRFQNHERKYILVKEEKFRPDFAYNTDSDVFEVFDLPMITGNPNQALKEPYLVVLTQTLAQRYFNSADILGEHITVLSDWNPEETRYKVTGVIQDMPSNTHLPIDLLFSFNNEEERSGWAYVYILLEPNSNILNLETKIDEFIQKYADEESAAKVGFEFQNITDIHLHSDLAREIVPNSIINYVYLFLSIGVFILLIGLINYTNLYSAMVVRRMRETSLRKILGASKNQIIKYVFLDSVFYHLMALSLAGIITILIFPYFQSLTEIELNVNLSILIPGMLLISILNSVTTIIYPLIIINKPNPLQGIKQTGILNFEKKSSALNPKNMLLAIQYTMSVLLIGSALIARDQFKFLNDSNLSITGDQILAIPAVPDKVRDDYQTFKNQLLSSPHILQVTSCMEVPSREIRDAGPVLVKGINDDPESAPVMDIQVIDHDFLNTLGIELVAGKNIPESLDSEPLPEFNENYSYIDFLRDKRRVYLINETAMKQLGWQSPDDALGQEISWSISDIELGFGPISGIVKDYHQETFKNKIDPTILVYEPIWLRTFLIKLNTDGIQETISYIQSTWNELFPLYPIEYHFLDDMYEELYKTERVNLKLLYMLCGLAVFISFIGLFGLIAYSLRTRLKEMAMRKVLGATIPALVRMMSKEYIMLLVIASFIAIPISYHLVHEWLQEYAYKTTISFYNYGITIIFLSIVIFLTISLQTIRTYMINPADTLREE